MFRHMDLKLAGKKALVTGSTAGIGLAIASALAAEDASVIVNGRTQRRVDEALRQLPASARGVAADLDGKEGVARLAELVADVDVLVNNVGIFEAKPFEQITDEEWL